MTFEPALQQMAQNNSDVFGPTSFQQYVLTNGMGNAPTAPSISVDNLSRLAPALRNANVMVFRLGQEERTRNTKFALARVKGGWSDYFLLDEEIFGSTAPEVFIPSGSARDLFVFQLLPTLTETSLVNLALASGLLGTALRLDEPDRPIIPATGQTVFSFKFQPHPSIETIWNHDRGQVEIDALFTAKRQGKETLFLVEAKSSSDISSLAKHKLVYPLLALRQHIPSYFDIVPVYLRVLHVGKSLHFLVSECAIETKPVMSLASLLPVGTPRKLVLQGFES